jgi:hypothetical protein
MSTLPTTMTWECPQCEHSNTAASAEAKTDLSPCCNCSYRWDRSISDEHEHPSAPCIYRGMNIWSCGHLDNP